MFGLLILVISLALVCAHDDVNTESCTVISQTRAGDRVALDLPPVAHVPNILCIPLPVMITGLAVIGLLILFSIIYFVYILASAPNV